MSRANVEIVRRWLEELPQDPEPFPAWAAGLWESDGDYYPVRSFPEARPCHGREEIVRFFAEFIPAWSEYRYVVKDARAIGDDRVFAHGEIHAAGRASGVALEGDTYHCCWLRHGRFLRVEDHLTAKGALHALGFTGETLEAAGLRE
jgi:SnoaL-like domain